VARFPKAFEKESKKKRKISYPDSEHDKKDPMDSSGFI
jgi:hypothetical protein